MRYSKDRGIKPDGPGVVDAERFARAAEAFGIRLTVRQWGMVVRFLNGLVEWNKKINLTGMTTLEDMLIKHVLDSMIPGEMIGRQDRVVDLGSGAGFPGIPLKILLKDIRLHLVEATRKKVSFLEWSVRALDLKGVDVLWSRAVKDRFEESFSGKPVDFVLSRAALKDREVLGVGRYLIGNRGRIVLMKGHMDGEDIAKIESLGKEFVMSVSWIRPYRLPGMARDRNLVVLEPVG